MKTAKRNGKKQRAPKPATSPAIYSRLEVSQADVSERRKGNAYHLTAVDSQQECVATVHQCCGFEAEHAKRLASGWNNIIGIPASAQPKRPMADALKAFVEFLGHLREAHTEAANGDNACAEVLLYETLETAYKLGDRLAGIARAMGKD